MTDRADLMPDTGGAAPRRLRLGEAEYVVDGIPSYTIEPWKLVTRDGLQMNERQFAALAESVRIKLVAQVELYVMSISGG